MHRFTFVSILEDGSAWHFSINAENLESAVDQYQSVKGTISNTVGVWQEQTLVGRFVPVLNKQTGVHDPLYQSWP